jgi:SAM-dependent methyltransferase
VQGVELSAWSSAHARERFGLPVVTGTLADANLPPAHFHVITLWDVIEHVPEPVALLTAAARVLRPDGRIVLTTGDWGSAYAQRRGAAWHLMTPPWHLSYFDRSTLAEAARRANLRLVAIRREGVAGDGSVARSHAGLVLSRILGFGDIMRVTLEQA